MSDVVDLASRRPERGFKACSNCGGCYFHLLPFPFEEGEHGVLTMSSDFTVSGWSGLLACSSCGTELPTPLSNFRPPPRAVE